MTRVAVDGRALTSEDRFRGIGVYLKELLGALSLRNDVDLAVLATADAGPVIPAGADHIPVQRRLGRRWERWESDLRQVGEIKAARADVYFSPGQEPPRACPIPWVQTIHSAIPFTFAHPDLEAEVARWDRIRPRVQRADAIVAVSSHVAEQAGRYVGLEESRVHVVHLGVSHDFTPPLSRPRRPDPYILYVGEYGPNKGYQEAFAAISELASRGYPHRLKVVGRIAPWTRPTIEAAVRCCSHPERVDLVGFVPHSDTVRLYQEAALMLYTSRCEGFGLPPLEAMATGLPVVSFENSSLGEVVGEGGILVTDGDVSAVVTAAAELLEDETLWWEWSKRGHAWSAGFTWEECARKTAQVFMKVANG